MRIMGGRNLFWSFLFVGAQLGFAEPLSIAGPIPIDETPANAGEWGFRPVDKQPVATTPPGFVWRPQEKAVSYELQCSRDPGFDEIAYAADGIAYQYHCPPEVFGDGAWYWRFRFADQAGATSAWSATRSFTVTADSIPLPMPSRAELIGRIPKTHPRLFVRPEQMDELRRRARGDLAVATAALVDRCDALLENPPDTTEPRKYPEGTVMGSEEWRVIWWGNRKLTINVLDAAATLGFTRLLVDNEDYGQLAVRLLLDAAAWDPKGSTGYRYNDEAGMPYGYYFARAYTFLHDMLTEEQRTTCRDVMRIRGRDMYDHLCPDHIWQPYKSHSNRAWHFLGEIGVAFLDEIPEAEDWTWFAVNVFFNAYPVWSDDDGGWHEGMAYWESYIDRFTWWADVMRVAMDIDAYRKPYFAEIGYYPMYLQPPGTLGGGFGDLTARLTADRNRGLMTTLAVQARNPYWQWYVDALGGADPEPGYIGFIRGSLPEVVAQPPDDLPTARVFRGTGQAVLSTELRNAADNVEIIFKSSPFGTQSHGYEAQNAFLLYAFGERLLIRTGRRDMYGSPHHRDWMWHTKSVNSITIDGIGQGIHSPTAVGRIAAFETSDAFDLVVGEAGEAYGDLLDRFTRTILFVKPELIVIHDRLEAPRPVTFEWRLHAPTEIRASNQRDIRIENGRASCIATFLTPSDLEISVTDQFDPPPRERIKLTEWHLTASTPAPTNRVEFVTVLRPFRTGEPCPIGTTLARTDDGGYEIDAALASGRAAVTVRSVDGETAPRIEAELFDAAGNSVAALATDPAGDDG